jgi:hypothetical protein
LLRAPRRIRRDAYIVAPVKPAGGFDAPGAPPEYAVLPQQLTYFETFGFVCLPGLFADDMAGISDAFDEVFSTAKTDLVETHEPVHFGRRRQTIMGFVERHEKLARLRDDPRILAIARAVVGPGYEYHDSDGSIFSAGTSWHADIFRSPLERSHVRLQLYLDPLDAASGALRFIPGTNHHDGAYATGLRSHVGLHGDPQTIEESFGVPPEQLPCWVVETVPGDLVVWSFRTLHASFGATSPRRALAMNFREAQPPTVAR